ncbi:MAG: MBL fold metallo-hydrolase [Chitinophagales bacterium]|nr:MBL fold metallo-hydrolase [Chitinophagaceae bacterium]MBP9882281.1 MBL fold metallo-hydrolase [Chitinophagales bacterium]
MKPLFLICAPLLLLLAPSINSKEAESPPPYLIILGNAQDAGYPHIACEKTCCRLYYEGKEPKHFVSSIAVIDPVSGERFVFDCTPDFPAQLHLMDSLLQIPKMPDAIFLTHAHIGHYTGLMYLGRESMNANAIKVFAMPEMNAYLQNNGPWSQLVQLKNIVLHKMKADSAISINERITVTPLLVPHRHEFTETVGFRITWPGKSILFIPDIDKWAKWNHDILHAIEEHDLLLIDGTFFDDGELSGRSMSEIPHPFIKESMQLFDTLSPGQKSKIWFIHLNHSNPALITGSAAQKEIESKGYHVAVQAQVIK